ncbi:ubiquinone/menaquinone biosynthesis C-methylase UbiE [Agrococcus sp. UYP10]|uniref:class I SAM-dependent methyltransferase n=1 Tax=Agrococcus sp. UYP10 TaxID=1756355 RepID=UPI00339224A0
MDASDYDAFAERYDAENAGSLLNAHYERPTMLGLAGDVAGRAILDAGCGSGPLTLALRERGAVVTGIDASPAMVALARARLGDDVPLHVGDLAEPLPFPDGAFDDVIASLVLHYLEDWDAPLAELRRVLRPGGRLILSLNHPTVRLLSHPHEDYFATRRYSDDFDFDGEPSVLTMWHRPLRAMTAAFTRSGFSIASIEEPPPSPLTPRELMPPRIASGERSAFLCFLFFVLERD